MKKQFLIVGLLALGALGSVIGVWILFISAWWHSATQPSPQLLADALGPADSYQRTYMGSCATRDCWDIAQQRTLASVTPGEPAPNTLIWVWPVLPDGTLLTAVVDSADSPGRVSKPIGPGSSSFHVRAGGNHDPYVESMSEEAQVAAAVLDPLMMWMRAAGRPPDSLATVLTDLHLRLVSGRLTTLTRHWDLHCYASLDGHDLDCIVRTPTRITVVRAEQNLMHNAQPEVLELPPGTFDPQQVGVVFQQGRGFRTDVAPGPGPGWVEIPLVEGTLPSVSAHDPILGALGSDYTVDMIRRRVIWSLLVALVVLPPLAIAVMTGLLNTHWQPTLGHVVDAGIEAFPSSDWWVSYTYSVAGRNYSGRVTLDNPTPGKAALYAQPPYREGEAVDLAYVSFCPAISEFHVNQESVLGDPFDALLANVMLVWLFLCGAAVLVLLVRGVLRFA